MIRFGDPFMGVSFSRHCNSFLSPTSHLSELLLLGVRIKRVLSYPRGKIIKRYIMCNEMYILKNFRENSVRIYRTLRVHRVDFLSCLETSIVSRGTRCQNSCMAERQQNVTDRQAAVGPPTLRPTYNSLLPFFVCSQRHPGDFMDLNFLRTSRLQRIRRLRSKCKSQSH